ncbi:MAG: sugar porter family MFS transporter [Bacteroidota bacterium]
MPRYLLWSFSVALAGFLFGFDTAVISGADKVLQQLWHSSNLFHGFVVMGMALWGTLVGAIFGSFPTDRWGRKHTLIGIGLLFLVSAIGSALASDPYTFAAFRFLGGLGVGASTIAAPAYISEIAPDAQRGRTVALYQLSIVAGILVAFLSNYLLRNVGTAPWRWMVGVEALPAFLYCIAIWFIPQSPRWLVLQGKREAATRVLKLVSPEMAPDDFVQQVMAHSTAVRETIFDRKYRTPLLLALFIACFNQFSGINGVLYYAPRIFEAAGLGSSTALLSGVGVGITNLVFTLVGMALIDRLGRRQLLYIGSIGYIVSLSLVACSFFLHWQGMAVPVFLFAFIAAHAIGQGTVIWVFIAEIFPTHLRASGQAFGSSVHWVLAAFIPSLIPVLISGIGPGWLFAAFALLMVGQLVWVRWKVPETKGVPLEALGQQLHGNTP